MNKLCTEQLPPIDRNCDYLAWKESHKVLIKTDTGSIHLARYHFETDRRSIMKISIDENGIWAGTGNLRDGIIEDCPAILGDDQDMAEKVYVAIEQAIADGESSVTMGGYTWTWEIIDA